MKLGEKGVIDSPSKNILYNGNAYNVATTLIHNIPKESYKDDIVARPYIKYVDKNGNDQIYYFTETQQGSIHAKGYFVSIYKAADYILKNDPNGYTEDQLEYLRSIVE